MLARHLDSDILWHIRNLRTPVAKNKHPAALPMPKKLHHTLLARASHGMHYAGQLQSRSIHTCTAMLVLTEASSSSMAVG